MRIILFLSFSLLMLFSKMAAAYTCSTPQPNYIRGIPTVTVARDTAVGDILGAFFPNSIPFSCVNSAPALTYQEFGVKAYGNYLMMINGRRVYSTNLPGIGYSVYVLATGCSGSSTASNVDGTNTIGGDVNTRLACKANGMIDPTSMSGTPGIVFYKTGPVTSGMVNATTVGALVLRNNQSTWQSPEVTFGFYSFSVNSTGCSLNNNIVSVDMGNVKKSEFTGIGSTPASSNTKDLSISLSCSTGTQVSFQVDGNIQDAANGLLNLNSASDAATGIAVQLLYNSKPLTLGARILLSNSSATTLTLPLQARYYQTKSTVTPGVANSITTLTMTYQ
ncbi:hypothetical protein IV04_04065 [Serratia sp. Ag1]|nr:hypothetical protein JV45_02420 [Serratia sp. Ag2]KFL00022.1 hypothetical protein IV04_04065 [Serratia sp. Ag1]